MSTIKFKKTQEIIFPADNILKYYKILYCLPKSFRSALFSTSRYSYKSYVPMFFISIPVLKLNVKIKGRS